MGNPSTLTLSLINFALGWQIRKLANSRPGPCCHLSLPNRDDRSPRAVIGILSRLRDHGVTLLVVTHESTWPIDLSIAALPRDKGQPAGVIGA